MGEPRHTNNVRRIDFSKAGARHSRLRAEDSAGRQPETGRLEQDRLKVVALPEPRSRRRHRSEKPAQNAMLAVIVVLAALLGALVAAVFLDPSL
ncbi:MAG: hypothetical protein K0S81_822 [Rhodospirillales bacterium]|nr:hypothetical protein [Rhodospirillales bacterium]